MNARALGWDIHRKFSMVSLMEIRPLERSGRSNGHGWSTPTRRRCELGCQGSILKSRWPWRRRSAGRGWPTCWKHGVIPCISPIRQPEGTGPARGQDRPL